MAMTLEEMQARYAELKELQLNIIEEARELQQLIREAIAGVRVGEEVEYDGVKYRVMGIDAGIPLLEEAEPKVGPNGRLRRGFKCVRDKTRIRRPVPPAGGRGQGGLGDA